MRTVRLAPIAADMIVSKNNLSFTAWLQEKVKRIDSGFIDSRARRLMRL